MKSLFLTGALIVCASSAAADEIRYERCDLIQTHESNAYYRANVNCPLVKQSTRDTARALSQINPILVGTVVPVDPLTLVNVEQPGNEGFVGTVSPDDSEMVLDAATNECERRVEPINLGVGDGDDVVFGDASGTDPSNPGQGGGDEAGAGDDGDNGHGNDASGTDPSNPGQGGGDEAGAAGNSNVGENSNGNGNNNGNAGGNGKNKK